MHDPNIRDGGDWLTPDDLRNKQMLSIHHQQLWRQLCRDVVGHTDSVTLVVGAGVSMDAGFPSWDALVRRICSQHLSSGSDLHLRDRILADPADLIRKTESIIELALERANSGRGPEVTSADIIAQALYERFDSPGYIGQLGQAVARLALTLGSTVRIVTTNFDDVLERAIVAVAPSAQVASHSIGDLNITIGGDDGYSVEWPESDADIDILHLHGYLPQEGANRGPVVLAESHFLEYGPHVRAVIADRLKSSLVIFLGVSVNDPNLTGPLWDVRSQRASASSAGPYVLLVPDVRPAGADRNVFDERAYMREKSRYLRTKLGLRPIFVKSYSQLGQAVWELALCAEVGTNYLKRAEIRYGSRLASTLDAVYTNLGCAKKSDAVIGEQSIAIQRSLSNELRGPDGKSGLLRWLRFQATQARKELERTGVTRANTLDQLPESEDFGLYLWLRSRVARRGGDNYTIQLVGSSEVSHRSAFTMTAPQEIDSESRFPAVASIYNGSMLVSGVGDTNITHFWKGVAAVPVRWRHQIDMDEGTTFDVPMTIGVVTLNSCRLVRPDLDDEYGQTTLYSGQRSVLSYMSPQSLEHLALRLEQLALRVIGLD